MKITNFNVNNIERRLTNLPNRLGEAQPTSSACEKPRAADADFPAEAIREAGYHAVWRGGARRVRAATRHDAVA
jgi:exodeoxyribonuclease-3